MAEPVCQQTLPLYSLARGDGMTALAEAVSALRIRSSFSSSDTIRVADPGIYKTNICGGINPTERNYLTKVLLIQTEIVRLSVTATMITLASISAGAILASRYTAPSCSRLSEDLLPNRAPVPSPAIMVPPLDKRRIEAA